MALLKYYLIAMGLAHNRNRYHLQLSQGHPEIHTLEAFISREGV
jgi:phage-related protein